MREFVVELAKRMLSGAGEARPIAIKGEESIELVKSKKVGKTKRKKTSHTRLDVRVER